MNTGGWWTLAAMLGALALQGCAQSGDVKAASQPAAAPPAVAAAPAPAQAAPAAAAPAGAAIPEDAKGKPVVAADTKDNFEAVAAAIRQQMEPGGRFAFVNPDGRAVVNARLADMSSLFDKYGSVDQMKGPAQAKLLDDQNTINEVLARYDANRRICHNELPVGSHIPKRVCRTLGEIQNEQNNSRQTMRIMQMKPSQVGGH